MPLKVAIVINIFLLLILIPDIFGMGDGDVNVVDGEVIDNDDDDDDNDDDDDDDD